MDISQININGYDTYFSEQEDNGKRYMLIAIPENSDKSISDICGQFINGHLIKEVDYCKIENEVKFIKAYY